MLVLILLKKAATLVQGLLHPLKAAFPEDSPFGIGMITFLSFLIIAFISYLAGWRAEKKKLKSFLPFVEDNILVLIPGYTLLRSRADEAVGEAADNWKAVLAGEEGDLKLGIEIEHQADGYCTVFFPDPPDAKSGEVRLIHSTKVQRLDIPASKLIAIARKYGHGSASILMEYENQSQHKKEAV
jgi:hypothetical protein